MDPVKHKSTRHLSILSILSVATFAIVVALATMVATGGRRDRALEQRWYGTLASGNPQIPSAFRTQDLVVDNTSTVDGSAFLNGSAAFNSWAQFNGSAFLGSGVGYSDTTKQTWGSLHAPSSSQFAWWQPQATTTTTQIWIQEDDVEHTGTGGNNEAINLVLRDLSTFAMGSGGNASAGALDIAVTTGKSSGSGQLTAQAIVVGAQGGDINYAVNATHGTIRADDGASFGPLNATGFNLGAAAATAGVFNATGAGANTINWSNASSSITAGQITSSSTFSANANAFIKGELRADSGAADWYQYPTTALTVATQRNLDISAGGTGGVIRFNSNTGGITHTGTGGIEVWPGNNNGSAAWGVRGTGHEFTNGTAPALNASCNGSGAAAITGTDRSFKLTTGTGSTSCTITFVGTYTVIPACVITTEGGIALPTYTISATAITMTVNTAATYNAVCVGMPGTT